MISIRVGTAGWTVPKETATSFPADGSHLERYAVGLNAVEINSSFYRSHRQSTYERWAASVPGSFRFAVKLPKQITHINQLIESEFELDQFIEETSGLGDKLGPILVQLPPSLAWSEGTVHRFFSVFRARHRGSIVCEPRHKSWFSDEVDCQLNSLQIGRVAADPAIVPQAAIPGGYREECYFRWHDSPRIYYSDYDENSLSRLENSLEAAALHGQSAWCIFDNTAGGAAIRNALTLSAMLQEK